MKNFEEKKATLMIIGVFVLIMIIVVVPLAITSKAKKEKESFPGYSEIEITEKTVKNDYEGIRQQLEKDRFFAKLAIMPDFNSDNYKPTDIEMMLKYFLVNYEVTNDKYFTAKYSQEYIYCMREARVIEAFKDLYNVDITNDISLLPGYYKYVYKKGNNEYCFDFDIIGRTFDNTYKVGVERFAILGTTITTDVYVYDFYNDESDITKTKIATLDSYINSKSWAAAKEVVENNLGGEVTHKQLRLKTTPKGKFFKYQLFSSKKLDY